jgi:glycosyltransferase involved in cell wall biosynthesis
VQRMGEAAVNEPARRIAVVTPEWPTTEVDPGPEALHAERLCVALLDAGWTPEVFTPADEPGPLDDDGILVHRVARGSAPPGMPIAEGFERILDRSILAAGLRKATNRRDLLASTRMKDRRAYFMRQNEARTMGRVLEERQQEAPFQAAITTEAGLAGLFVPARRSRPHIVRVSSEPELWRQNDEDPSPYRRRMVADQRKVIEQAQAVYASTQVVADAVHEELGVDVTVVRPPAPVEPDTGPRRKGLPRRYLAFCGPLDLRHGAETLAAALPMAWREAPDLTMVLAGPVDRMALADWRTEWRDHGDRVVHVGELLGLDRTIERRPAPTTAGRKAQREAEKAGEVPEPVKGALGTPVPAGEGEPVGRGDLVAMAARAVALVVPALLDDVDEIALQALASGVPVIATASAGTAEVIEDDRTGLVVPTGSPSRLADALVRAWTGRWNIPDRVEWDGPVRAKMEPATAAAELLSYVAEVRETWREPAPQG